MNETTKIPVQLSVDDVIAEVNAARDAFNAKVVEIIRRHSTAPPPPSQAPTIVPPPPNGRQAAKKGRRGKQGRRPEAEIQSLAYQIAGAVAGAGDAGIGARALRDYLHLHRDQISHPLKVAVELGLIAAKGERRGTRYFRAS